VIASIVVPWELYLSVPEGALPDVMTADALWGALWPVLVGSALAAGLGRIADRLPRIPEGDVAVGIDAAGRRPPAIAAARRRQNALRTLSQTSVEL